MQILYLGNKHSRICKKKLLLLSSSVAERHEKGGEAHQVLSRGALHTMGSFQGQNRINKEII